MQSHRSNPDGVKRAQTKYQNTQRSRDRYKRYYITHKEQGRAKNKKFRENNPHYDKEHYERNPGKYKTTHHRRSARKRGLPDTFTEEQWSRCLDYFGHCCAVCGRPAGFWHTIAADHWIALSDPRCPGTIATNIVPLCHGNDGCNNSKHNFDPSKWLIGRCGKSKAARIAKRIERYFKWVESCV